MCKRGIKEPTSRQQSGRSNSTIFDATCENKLLTCNTEHKPLKLKK